MEKSITTAELESKKRMENLELVLVRAMEHTILGKDEYTYAEVNAVLVKLLNHNLSEELKGELDVDSNVK